METRFRLANKADYPALAAWLVQISQAPEQQCLHTWAGQSADDLQQQLLGYLEDGELHYVLALHNDQLAGAMGCEYDEQLGRGWLHGPHAAAKNWEDIAQELYNRLLVKLPISIRQLHAYLNIENKRGRHFYAQQGFEEKEAINYDFWLTPATRTGRAQGTCAPLDREQEASFTQLFETLFPTAYYSAGRIISMNGQSHQVLVAAQGDEVLGFIVVSLEQGPSTGEIQFLGVRQDCQRQGYGRQLLLAGIDWLCDRAGVSGVCLNVDQELVHARALYESVGFELHFTGVGLHRLR